MYIFKKKTFYLSYYVLIQSIFIVVKDVSKSLWTRPHQIRIHPWETVQKKKKKKQKKRIRQKTPKKKQKKEKKKKKKKKKKKN